MYLMLHRKKMMKDNFVTIRVLWFGSRLTTV